VVLQVIAGGATVMVTVAVAEFPFRVAVTITD